VRYYEHGDNRCCAYPAADFCLGTGQDSTITIREIEGDVLQLNKEENSTFEAARVTCTSTGGALVEPTCNTKASAEQFLAVVGEMMSEAARGRAVKQQLSVGSFPWFYDV